MTIGRTTWALAEGYIPIGSHGPAPAMISHETVCILNAGDRDAQIEIHVYFADREPVVYRVTYPARRTRHVRFNDLAEPEPIPHGTELRQRAPLRRPHRRPAHAPRLAPGGERADDHHCVPRRRLSARAG